MSISDPTVLTKDVYTKVLTNVTYQGTVYIVDQTIEPSEYQVAFVDTGGAAPAASKQGISFADSFSPAISTASDYYVKPVNSDGKVIIVP